MKAAILAILVLVGTVASLRSDDALAVPGVVQPGEGFGEWETLESADPLLDDPRPAAVGAQQLPGATSDIDITYVDMPAQMRSAIDFAAAIWETQITSTVKTRATIYWVSLPASFLAQTRVAYHVQDPVEDPKLPLADVRYPAALAHTIRGHRTNEMPDMEIRLNSTLSPWYTGLLGEPLETQFDVITVILHELGHGYGIGTGIDWTKTLPVVSPTVYDTFISLRDGSRLSVQPLPALMVALVGGELFFNGPSTTIAAGGMPPRLHAPAAWAQASSLSHLHEWYMDTDSNALIAPRIGPGWVLQLPGPIMLAMLKDIGWKVSRLGQATRLRIVGGVPSFVQSDQPMAPVRIEVQDPVGVLVTSGSPVVVTLSAFGEHTSPTGDWECQGNQSRTTNAGKAVYEGCRFAGAGFASFVASAPGFMNGSTHRFWIADLSTARAIVVARGP